MIGSEERDRLRANLEAVTRRIEEAAVRAGRSPSDVTVLAATKYVSRPVVEELLALGVRCFGENRLQGAEEKVVRKEGVAWHMIGHLQRNKVRKALRVFDWIESVDSLRLAEKLEEEASRVGMRLPILVEVNVSEEASKTGLPSSEAIPLLARIASLPHLDPRGMMAMAPLSEDAEAARPSFIEARRIRDEAREATGLALPDLSMGMSQDYDVAIEEGATIVRIGQALYEGVV